MGIGKVFFQAKGRKLIVHLITGLGVGGAETFLFRYLESLPLHDRSKHCVVSLSGPGYYADRLNALLVPTHIFDFYRNPFDFLRFFLFFFSIDGFLRRVKVFCWMYHPMALSAFLWPKSFSIIWMVRRSLDGVSKVKPFTRFLMAASKFLSYFVPDIIVYNSDEGRRSHVRYGYSDAVSKVIQNGVDAKRFFPMPDERKSRRKELLIPETAFVVASVGRLEAIKGPDVLRRVIHDAISLGDDIFFVVIGRLSSAYDKDFFLSGLQEDRHDKLIFLGQISDVPLYLQVADVMVSCSYCEGFPNAVAEAMSIGLIPVVTDVGDSALLVDDEQLVVPVGDHHKMVRVISHLYCDRIVRQEKSIALIERANTVFSFEAAVEKLSDL